jgi:hypothetical protein
MYILYGFVISLFMMTNHGIFNVGSITPPAFVSVIMLVVLLLKIINGKRVKFNHPALYFLIFLIIWSILSLILNLTIFFSNIPAEAHSYPWATGLNSTYLRGVSFLVRLFLCFIVIQFIIIYINTREKYLRITYFLLLISFIVNIYLFLQVFIFVLFKLSIGFIYFDSQLFRIGGYFGEPSLTASLLIGNLFINHYAIKSGVLKDFISTRKLRINQIVSFIAFIFTFSTSFLVGFFIIFLIIELNDKKIAYKVLLFIVVFLIIYLIPPLKETIITKLLGEGLGDNPRTLSWISGLLIFKDNFILGVGLGNSVFFMSTIMAEIWPFLSDNDNYLLHIQHRFPPLNSHIQIMSELGLVGISLILCIFYILFKSRLKEDNKNKALVNSGYGGTICAYLIAMNGVPDYYYMNYFIFVIAMYIAGLRLFNRA